MLLEGKKGLILGVANKRSIAHAVAVSCKNAGAEIALTYQDERLLDRVAPLAAELSVSHLYPCDVTRLDQVERLFEKIEHDMGQLDFLVHALAFAKKEELEGEYMDTSPDGFRLALDISSYSLTSLARRALPLMKDKGGSIVTMSYLGGERVVPHYNVMGVAKAALEMSVRYLAYDLGKFAVRVNAVSAGPVKTLAAAGIKNFSTMLDIHRARTPMRRNITVEEVADATLFLLSDMATGITGETLHVDAGYHAMGM
ncbi:MAG: enoyl-ACP reductase [Planctomycetes bacterium]|nr:enoyl-ACP reductase [Planctomycetota bacterium]MCB9891926.1 enoyl-ACP reductase [Planctomycetota bacterium]